MGQIISKHHLFAESLPCKQTLASNDRADLCCVTPGCNKQDFLWFKFLLSVSGAKNLSHFL